MKTSELTPFGLKCRELRLARDQRILEQAEALDLEIAEVIDYETGKRQPTEAYAKQMALWLKASADDLKELLSRIPRDGAVVQFSRIETRELRTSRRSLGKTTLLSASVVKLHKPLRGPPDGPAR